MELARQLTWAEERGRLYHYRTKDKLEVDAVIETPDGRVIAIEVKFRALPVVVPPEDPDAVSDRAAAVRRKAESIRSRPRRQMEET